MASSKEENDAIMHEKLHQLRTITRSTSANETSIINDASKYIEELKQKLDKEAGSSGVSTDHDSLPMVVVQALDIGFFVNVTSDKNSPGLLANVLESIDEIGVEVVDARVSCVESFHLEAVGKQTGGSGDRIDAQAVKQAILRAIKNTSVQD